MRKKEGAKYRCNAYTIRSLLHVLEISVTHPSSYVDDSAKLCVKGIDNLSCRSVFKITLRSIRWQSRSEVGNNVVR